MNQTLTQIQEEFEEKYAAFEFCDQDNMTITKPQMKKLSDFLTQSNHRVLEKVKEMVNKHGNNHSGIHGEYLERPMMYCDDMARFILDDLSLIEQK